ncbi:hypothetical protein [Streptomyces sp. KL116D]|uniref:hypothetical protein n=1 Tax=Streptomyces sp. KL116D TaxID=3045152 RepID=UPI00355789DA
MAPPTVRGLALPAALTSLIDHDLWRHPGDAVLAKAIPWLKDPLAFVPNPEQMAYASQSMDMFADDPHSASFARHAEAGVSPHSNCHGSTLNRRY